MFYEESYSAFRAWLSFITKLNSNQLNIKKIKSTKIILKKKYYKKENKKNWKKTLWGKTVSIYSILWGKVQCFPHMF
jgi:hypothetical protein